MKEQVWHSRPWMVWWMAVLGLLHLPGQAAVVINEIHYAPDVKTEWVEFIELHNPDAAAVDLAGWSIGGGVRFTFPPGTSLAAAAYLVVAQDPAALQAKFRVAALGPWEGRLDNHEDRVVLRDATGETQDEVAYQLGFPWPTVGDPPGNSIELAHPSLDNNLGGSWRASASAATNAPAQTLLAAAGSWRYLKGLAEASSPANAWRLPGFDDSGWTNGTAPIGYGEDILATVLADMRGGYTTVYFRKTFEAPEAAAVGALQLNALYDDGFIVWINGVRVLSQNVPGDELPCGATANSARESLEFTAYNLPPPSGYLVSGANVIAVQGLNSGLSSSSDFFMDFSLVASPATAGQGPTPGARNSVFSPRHPPQVRQVEHHPKQPGAGEKVRVTAKITDPDGVAGVSLFYQVVDPGNYIALTDTAYQSNWVALAMNDAGVEGDAMAGDGVFTVEVPGLVQTHRRLVRYRLTAVDTGGQGVTAPYPDDPQPNFAYFVYDGVPAWSAAIQPGSTDPTRRQVRAFDTNVMRRLPVYHLIASSNAVMRSQYIEGYTGDAYKWSGTLVYGGEVYDHIHYRARGGVWRYAMGKNMWKFDFNRGHDFKPLDDYGAPYRVPWTKLNLGACIQQGDYQHRGEQGLFESVGFRLFNLAGVPASKTHFVHFRVVDEADESNATNQYRSDFWGLYLAVEQDDGRFLDEHELADGNFYKMEGGTGELNNQGLTAATDKSDLNQFLTTYRSGNPTDSWWRTNFHLAQYYSYQAIVQGIHHYDICYQKNYFYYRDPESGLWSVHPWDLDLTWADNMYDSGCGGTDEFKNRVLQRTAFGLEYRNRVREVRDLLFNTNQTWELIDEYAARICTAGQLSFVDADRAQWDYNPIMNSAYVNPSKAGQGRFYQVVPTKDFPGMIKKMKAYVVARGAILDGLARDAAIPARPVITTVGATNFPVNRLRFQTTAYSGAAAFGALQWRLGEITDTNSPAFSLDKPRQYEIEPSWQTDELTNFAAEIAVPPGVAKVGHTYRARVRMKDVTGRWSNWSLPVQFVAGVPDNTAALRDHLRISELMYNPPLGSEFEFLELHNTSLTLALDLGGVRITGGIEYTFPEGASLPPEGYLLVVRASAAGNFASFRAHYRLDDRALICGPYSGALGNDGESLTLRAAAGGADLITFSYQDGRGWPVAADGAGHSLVPLASSGVGQLTGALDYGAQWRASAFLGGSPGQADPPPPQTVLLNEVMAHTDYQDPLHPEYDSNDWIELYNPTTQTVELRGYYLSDDPADLRKWALPSVALLPGAWVSFDEVTGFHQPITNGFGLNKAGEELFLSRLVGDNQDRVVDGLLFKGQEPNYSVGRFPDGTATWRRLTPTRDRANALAPLSIVVNELMYHPPDLLPGGSDDTADEFIELLNPTPEPVVLQNTDGVWRISGEVDFFFPTNTSLPANGYLVLVSFNPTDALALEDFRRAYQATHRNFTVLGPYQGRLSNLSGRVSLEQPQAGDLPGEPLSWVIVDEVIYADQSPWPASADGLGDSLQRVSASAPSSQAASWLAGPPTPGAPNLGGPPQDSDGDGLPDAWELANDLDPLSAVGANGPDGDPDGDLLTNLAEFQLATDPRAPNVHIIALEIIGDTVTLTCMAPANQTLTVQYRESLTTGEWVNLASLPVQPTTGPRPVTDPTPLSSTSRFYRVIGSGIR